MRQKVRAHERQRERERETDEKKNKKTKSPCYLFLLGSFLGFRKLLYIAEIC